MGIVTMTFNDQDFSDLIEIHDIRRDVGNGISYDLSNALSIGSVVLEKRINPKSIEVDFSIWSRERNMFKRKLAKIFNTSTEAKLTFSDEAEVYYMARVEGEVRMKESDNYRSVGTVTFLIPDGVAHSTTYKTYNTPSISDRKLVFDVVNNGSVPAHPIINVVNVSENGYLGFVCAENKSNTNNVQYSLMEVGNRQVMTTEVVQKSKAVFDYKDMNTALNAGTKGQPVPGISGTFGSNFTTENGPNGTKRLTVPSGASSIFWSIPSDASATTNERLAWNQTLTNSGFAIAGGKIQIVVSDTAGQFLYGVETSKSGAFDQVQMRLMATNGQGGVNTLKTQEFSTSSYSFYAYSKTMQTNPFGSNGANVELSRTDHTIILTFPGGNWTVQVPELKGKKTGKVHVAISKSLALYSFAPTICGIHSISYRMDYTPHARKIPNRYPAGTEVEINCETNRIIVNGLDRLNDLVHGSGFLEIPPGQSTIEVYRSDFSTTPPRVELSFEERWL